MKAHLRKRLFNLPNHALAHGRIDHDATISLSLLALELWLDKTYEDGPFMSQRREHFCKRGHADEAQIAHDHIERRSQVFRSYKPDIRAFEHAHARVLTHLPGKLPIVHINAGDFSSTSL